MSVNQSYLCLIVERNKGLLSLIANGGLKSFEVILNIKLRRVPTTSLLVQNHSNRKPCVILS